MAETTESVTSFKEEHTDLCDTIAGVEDKRRKTLLDRERLVSKVVALTYDDIMTTVVKKEEEVRILRTILECGH